MKKIYLISSSLENSHGGIKSLAKLLLKTYHEKIFSLNPLISKIQFLKSFFRDRVIYIPCYHPSNTMRRKFLAMIYEKTIFRIYLNAKFVICLSENEVNLLKKLNPSGNFIYIPMPSALTHSIISAKEKLLKNKIIFVGRDDSNKNLNAFLTIAKNLRDIAQTDYEFIVVSDTNRTFPDWITHLKSPTDSELKNIYFSTAAIVIPSKWESLSLVGIEAIQFGGKVICNHNVMLSNLMPLFDTLILNNYDDIAVVRGFLEKSVSPDQVRLFNDYFSEKQFIQKFEWILKSII
jgi:glycosyltransferase involved in cell wall biosynthesis